MQRSNFDGNSLLSGFGQPSLFESTLTAMDFIEVTREILGGNYKGVIDLSTEITSFEYINISEISLIKLFKRIVCNSELKQLINVNLCCNSEYFSIKIGYSDGTRFERSFEREIIKLARNSGLEAKRADEGLCFFKKVFKPTAISVFSNILARAQLERMYREIFFAEE